MNWLMTFSRSSGTRAMPTLGLVDALLYAVASAPAAVRALKMVVFPTSGSPTIPTSKAIGRGMIPGGARARTCGREDGAKTNPGLHCAKTTPSEPSAHADEQHRADAQRQYDT